MHVLVIGGGAMGRCAAESLAGDAAFDRITVADLDAEAAASVAEACGEKATGIQLDVLDADALAATMKDADVVVTTAGPFYRLGRPVLEAAIAAGVNYVDINDDWEPTLEMLELSDEAKAAGLTAVIGMGSSPGISNVLARAAVDEVDEVELLYTGWLAGAGRPPEPGEKDESNAAFEHWMHQCSGTVRIWIDGGFQDVPPLEDRIIDYPGLGAASVWVCGHPEAVTLPTLRPEMRECINVMTARPGLIRRMRHVAARFDAGELDMQAAMWAVRANTGVRGAPAGERAPYPPMFVYVEGRKDGKKVRVGVTSETMPDGGMGPMTGIPAAIVASMVARGEITERGVLPPEQAVVPSAFMAELARRSNKTGEPITVATAVDED